jgi:hypothetical protein
MARCIKKNLTPQLLQNRQSVECTASRLFCLLSLPSRALAFFLLPGPSFVLLLRCHFEGPRIWGAKNKKRFEVPIKGPHLTKRPHLAWGLFLLFTKTKIKSKIFFFWHRQSEAHPLPARLHQNPSQ